LKTAKRWLDRATTPGIVIFQGTVIRISNDRLAVARACRPALDLEVLL